MTSVLNPAHQRILQFIYDYIEQFGYAPTMQEIAEGTGWSSRQAVWPHIQWLVKNGYLRNERGKPRTIALTQKGMAEL